MKNEKLKFKTNLLLFTFIFLGYNFKAISQDGPYVFYENNQAVVQTISSNGTLTTNNFPNMMGRTITCYSPQLNKSFTIPIKANLADEQAVYASTPSKFYSISDFEGEFLIFYTALLREGVINSDFQWTYGNGHLVVLGDVFSRGDYVNECLWLIYKLEAEAEAAGGKVHYIMGNHEMFHIMRNDFRYTTQKYFNTAIKLGKEMYQLYDNNSELGRWLRTKNIITKLGDYILVHGGVSQNVHNSNFTIQHMNDVGRARMRGPLNGPCTGDCDVITNSTDGLYWYRGIANGEVTQTQVNQFLTRLGGKRMIIGHTKGTDIRTLYQNKVILIDQNHQNNWTSNFTRALQQDNGCFNRATGNRLSPFTIAYQKIFSTCDVLSTDPCIGNTPPTVNLTKTNQSFIAGIPFVVTASASDNGSVAKIEFWQGSTLLATDNTTPYEYTINSINAGSFTIVARAYDNCNAQTNSASQSYTATVSCADGVKNGTEIGVDCGGNCTPCQVSSCINGVLTLKTDNYPEETSWIIRNASNTVVYSRNNYTSKNTTHTEQICLVPGCYTFLINDSASDGICCGYGQGNYEIVFNGQTLISGGAFTASESKQFCVAGTASPTCNDGIKNGDETGVDCGGSCPPCSTVTYCTSNGQSTQDEYISNVLLNTINHPSGAGTGGYSNFTSISTSLTKGASYTLTVTPKWPGSKYAEGYAVWIDYNQNGTFESTERVWFRNPTTTSPVSGSITIPSTATNGPTRMRVSMKYNALPASCGIIDYGEVEDYTVVIANSNGALADNSIRPASDINVKNGIKVFPNPVTDVLTLLDFEVGTTAILMDVNGRVLEKINIIESDFKIDLGRYDSGVYILKSGNSIQKIIKQ